MVSIRYFCGVGEFCRMKSKPCGRVTSNTGAAGGAAASIKVRTHDRRSRAVGNLDPSIAQHTARGALYARCEGQALLLLLCAPMAWESSSGRSGNLRDKS